MSKIRAAIALLLLIILLQSVALVYIFSKQNKNVSKQIRANVSGYNYINPLLFSNNDKDNSSYSTALNKQIFSYSDSVSKKGISVSVYFRDLNSSRWTGVNENDSYSPASMLKVIVAMAILKTAEENPTILSRVLHYVPEESNQYFKPKIKLAAGNYKVDFLIDRLITESDNGANTALLNDPEISKAAQQTYTLFRLPSGVSNSTDYMSSASYAVIFRTLYNSTFFQWGLSEQLLSLLTKTTFTKGLASGIPSSVAVSHKFGEYEYVKLPENVTLTRELHDCGIVYYPKSPYLLCIMTKGDSYPELLSTISDISKLVYNYVNDQNKNFND